MWSGTGVWINAKVFVFYFNIIRTIESDWGNICTCEAQQIYLFVCYLHLTKNRSRILTFFLTNHSIMSLSIAIREIQFKQILFISIHNVIRIFNRYCSIFFGYIWKTTSVYAGIHFHHYIFIPFLERIRKVILIRNILQSFPVCSIVCLDLEQCKQKYFSDLISIFEKQSANILIRNKSVCRFPFHSFLFFKFKIDVCSSFFYLQNFSQNNIYFLQVHLFAVKLFQFSIHHLLIVNIEWKQSLKNWTANKNKNHDYLLHQQ